MGKLADKEELAKEIEDVLAKRKPLRDTKHYQNLLRLAGEVRRSMPDAVRALRQLASEKREGGNPWES